MQRMKMAHVLTNEEIYIIFNTVSSLLNLSKIKITPNNSSLVKYILRQTREHSTVIANLRLCHKFSLCHFSYTHE